MFIHANWRMDVRVKWNMYETVKENYHFHIEQRPLPVRRRHQPLYTYGNLYRSTKGDVHLVADEGVKMLRRDDIQVSADRRSRRARTTRSCSRSYSEVTLKVGGNFIKVDMTA